MKKSENVAQALIVDWWGPYRLESAASACSKDRCEEGVYVVFGRHTRLAWWPLWYENTWITSGFSKQSKLTTRAARLPVQYIGVGVDLAKRLKHNEHKKLRRLDPQKSLVFVAKPRNELHPTSRKGKHQTAVKALEDALIYAYQPRLNQAGTRKYLGGELACWMRDETEMENGAEGALSKLPNLLLCAQSKTLELQSGFRKLKKRKIIWARKLNRRPVFSLSIYLERHFPKLFERLFGLKAMLHKKIKRSDDD